MSQPSETITSLGLLPHYDLFINGEFVPSTNPESKCTSKSPVDGTTLSTFANATKEDVDKAVDAAWEAFKTWKKTTQKQRSAILLKIADAIEANKERLAKIETMDNGKAYRESLNVDIPMAIDHFRYFAGCILAEEGSSNIIDEKYLSVVLREPIGVVGQIVPWNFPFLMGAWKLAPVLAAGDCTVFKPSSETSLSILEFARITKDIIPKGVFNIVTGRGSQSGQYLLDHPKLSKLAFTGSTEVGLTVGLAAAKKIIPATLELGGKSPNIFFDDCDFDMAIDGACLGILLNQGQVCCAGSRIFVQDTFYDKFVDALIKQFNSVKVGNSLDINTMMGAQVNEKQLQKILEYVKLGEQEGCKIGCGGVQIKDNGLDKGCYMRPTLLLNATNKMRVAQEEIFGPVAVVIKFHDVDEVIAMANDSIYGLGGAVFTKDINKAIKVARGVETGKMWINTYNSLTEGTPFGGYKQSGIGREVHKIILEHYTQVKNIMINMQETPSGFYPKAY
jgi:acyl-CoA reductase-like NAD-dependent aldehyde dehydrogenase